MLLLRLFFITILYYLPVYSAKSSSADQGRNDEMAKIFCNKLGLAYKSGFLVKTDYTKANNKAFEDCKTRFVSYITSKGMPEDEDMNNFIDICNKESNIPLYSCSLVIDHLKELGYDLKTAGRLLRTLTDRSSYNLAYVYKDIKLDYSLWEKLQAIDNLHIETCTIYYFTSDTQVKHDIMNSYISWIESDKGSKKSCNCNCRHVFGLYEIYKERGENDIKILYDYFDNVCTIEFRDKNLWTDNNFKCIAKSKKKINGAILKQFITRGIFLARTDWCQYGTADWPFDFIYDKINLTENSLSLDAVEAISYSQKEHFSVKDYNKFLQIIAPYGNDFHNDKCIKSILKIAFVDKDARTIYAYDGKRKLWGYNPSPGYSESYGLQFGEKEKVHPFNIHIELLLQIFRNTNPSSVVCNDQFVNFLSQFKAIIEQRNFLEDYVTRDLTEFVSKKTTTVDLIQCYQFTLDLEDRFFNKFFMLPEKVHSYSTPSYNFYGYVSEFSEFTSHFFKKPASELYPICRNENKIENINSKTNIENLLKSVFKNIEFTTLENFFNLIYRQVSQKTYSSYLH